MEIRELKYFLAVAREESISRAAEAMFVTQPNLSRQMKKLEDEAGRQLFVRGNRKTELTEAGKLLKKRAEEIIELHDRLQAEMKTGPEGVSGDVKIGGGESRAFGLIARAICAVRMAHPAVKCEIYSGDSEAIGEKLDKGLIDFGVFIEPAELDRHDSLPLPMTDRWGVLMRRDSPLADRPYVTRDDLEGLPVIRSRHSMGRSRISEWFGGDDRCNVAATYNLLYNASLLVEQGAGYAVGLEGLINTEGSELCFRPLEPEVVSRLYIARKKYRPLSPAAEIFLAELKKLL